MDIHFFLFDPVKPLENLGFSQRNIKNNGSNINNNSPASKCRAEYQLTDHRIQQVGGRWWWFGFVRIVLPGWPLPTVELDP